MERTGLSRAQLLAGGVKSGVALVAGGSLLAFARPARADTEQPAGPPEEDLALIRLAASAELLAREFYSKAIASRQFSREERSYLGAARANETAHYSALKDVLGVTAPVAEDFQFSLPSKSFDTRRGCVQLGIALETAFVGAYLGAVNALQTPALRGVAGQIAASEAMHLSVFSDLASGHPIGGPFPAALDIEQATDALAPYLGD